MVVKAVITFLIKVFPLFFLVLIGWQQLGLAEMYHAMVALVMTLVYPLFDSTGLVNSIGSADGSFVIELMRRGVSLGSCDIVGGDITSNTAMLLSLYLASPILLHPRKYLIFVGSSLAVLFVIHCFTLGLTIYYAFSTNPDITRRFSLGNFAVKFADSYVYFYEIMGMYLCILALWLPYIYYCIIEVRRRTR
jgi:hypothetical protein